MSIIKESLFERLSQINVSNYTEKKGNFSYLSWSWAVAELKKVSPEAYWIIHEWGTEGNERPYQQTESGCFVKVTVIADGVEMTQIHPVLDNRNQTIKKPNAFEINTSIQRCLVKAIALHGLGLYIYAGEDLPTAVITKEQSKQILNLRDNEAIDGDTLDRLNDWIDSKKERSFWDAEKVINGLVKIIDEYNGLEK